MEKNRIQKHYSSIVVEDLLILYNYQNIMQLPYMRQAVLNISSKNFLVSNQEILNAFATGFLLTGQKGVATRARRSIATFHLHKGNMLGCMTTVRRKNMYTLFDKMTTCGLPRLQNQSSTVKQSFASMRSKVPASLPEYFSTSKRLLLASQRRTARSAAARSPSPYGAGAGVGVGARERSKVAASSAAPAALQAPRRNNLDLQFGVKETEITFFPEVASMFEALSTSTAKLSLQGLHVVFSFIVPRSNPKTDLFDSNSTPRMLKQTFSGSKAENQKDSIFLSAFQYPATPF